METYSYYKLPLLVLIGVILIFSGCAGGLARYYPLDSPEHHFETGMRLIEKYGLDAVQREFIRAQELDEGFAPAYVGLALVSSARGNFDNALRSLEKARKISRNDKDIAIIGMGTIKIYTDIYLVDKKKGTFLDWLKVAENAYQDGLKFNEENTALHFYMGRAYKIGEKYDKAKESFRRVVKLKAGYIARAMEELEMLDRTVIQDHK